jgi:hypothetical protein
MQGRVVHVASVDEKMTTLSKISTRWPMLYTALGIVLTFSLFVPVLWLFSNLLVDGVRNLSGG